jgi:acyl-coenzyme A synthetase/AMP-(fatty) acid ligase/thioesterase domain-containing protein/acyl carrier protein
MSEIKRQKTELPPEQEAIRAKCFHPTGTFVEFKQEEIEQSVPERFEKVVRNYADRIAIITKDRSLTYVGLNNAANRVAHGILQKLGECSEPVLFLADHGPISAVGCLGILKAGKTVIAIDPSYPVERIGYIRDDSRATAILTDGHNISAVTALTTAEFQVLNLDAFENDLSQQNTNLDLVPDFPAEIRYSSGSTGKPKGIVRTHRRLLEGAMLTINSGHICPADRLLAMRRLSFGCNDMLKGLLAGAALCPFDIKKNGFAVLADLMNQEKVTYYTSSSSIFRYFMCELTENDTFPSVRLLQIGDDPLSSREIQSYRKHFSDECILVYRLSCGEAGNLCQNFIDKNTHVSTLFVPVGYPVEGKEILLLDESGREVELGQIGEIAVKSRYSFSEYLRKPELTAVKFLPDSSGGNNRIYLTGDLGRMLPDGRLVYLGRKDLDVKIRGCKVALTEVEAALREFGAIVDAAVKAWEHDSGDPFLVAYLISRSEARPETSELFDFLKTKLPDYMIPSRFVFLNFFPSINGKLDRNSLPPPPDQKRSNRTTPFVAPKTPVEKKLSRIWTEVLSIDEVGIRDNFFDLGGNSLLTVRVFAEIEKELGKRLPLATIFQTPTIEQLATALIQEESAESQFAIWSTYPSSVVPFRAKGSKPPLFWFNWGPWDFRLPRYLGSDQPVYGLQHQSQDGHRALYTSIEEMAAYYIQEIRNVQSKGPYVIGGLCIGGVVAFEMAQQLQMQGQEVALLVLLDPTNPLTSKLSSTHKGVTSLSSHVTWFCNKVNRHLHELAPLGPEEKLSYALVRVNGRIMGLREKINWFGRRFLCDFFGCPLPPSLRTHYVTSIYSRARRAYAPQPYRGRVILFKTQGRYRSGQSGWENLLAGSLEIQELDTDHDNVFKEPYVRTFAEKLKIRLSDVQSDCRQEVNPEPSGECFAVIEKSLDRIPTA